MNFPVLPLSSNFTTPETSANKVSSLPRPTFFPGFHFVPRCRARMLPPRTLSPPNFFRPNRCEFESRPLRDEPTPFLCAIFNSLRPYNFNYTTHDHADEHLGPQCLSDRINL